MMVIELRAAFVQQVVDRQLSLPLNQCLRSIDQHFHTMHCQDRRLELFTLRTSSSGNLVTQILFQVRVVNAVAMPCLLLVAFAHIDPENYI